MPLNYSKWDTLELSDDSDIEGHPNVDHKSLVRWKQRQIHEEREARKNKILHLQAELQTNPILETRLRAIKEGVKTNGATFFTNTVEKLQKSPSPEKPPPPLVGTYDSLVLSLLGKMIEEVNKDGIKAGDPKLDEELIKKLDEHLDRMPEYQKTTREQLAKEESEQKKKITSDDIRDGFDAGHVTSKQEPAPLVPPKSKAKGTTTEYEVLNPNSAAAAATKPEDDDDDDVTVPEMTPVIEQFSKLPLGGFSKSWDFIKEHRDVVVPGASDALLVAAFRAERAGNHAYAKQCTHQSLLLQYGEKLGRDGVTVFFRKMINADTRATSVFLKDVEETYAHLVERVRISKLEDQEAAAAAEQIQLVPENPDATIGFNVPDGPPPEHITLEGPGTEGMNIEDVRKALQLQWEVYDGFSSEMQEALKTQSLETVNKVLGAMKVAEAERVVELLQMSGILSFADGGIRDETGQEEEGTDEEEAVEDAEDA